jgi:hypothetical protein
MLETTLRFDELFRSTPEEEHHDLKCGIERYVSAACADAGIILVNDTVEWDSKWEDQLDALFEAVELARHLITIFGAVDEDGLSWVEMRWVEGKPHLLLFSLNENHKGVRKDRTSVWVYDLRPYRDVVDELIDPLYRELYRDNAKAVSTRYEFLARKELEEFWWRWWIDMIHPHAYNAVAAHLDSIILEHFQEAFDEHGGLQYELRETGLWDMIIQLPGDYRFFEVFIDGEALFLIASHYPYQKREGNEHV